MINVRHTIFEIVPYETVKTYIPFDDFSSCGCAPVPDIKIKVRKAAPCKYPATKKERSCTFWKDLCTDCNKNCRPQQKTFLYPGYYDPEARSVEVQWDNLIWSAHPGRYIGSMRIGNPEDYGEDIRFFIDLKHTKSTII